MASDETRSETGTPKAPAPIISVGYKPGLIGDVVALHAVYYSRRAGFGAAFEAKVAGELAEFIGRLDRGKSQIWHVDICGRVGASIAIDGEDLGDGKAHLRWFISDNRLQGQAVGTRLLAAALGFCDEQGFAETHLWTFEGLATARRLYERNGFLLAEQWAGRQWGEMVEEQRFVRLRPAPEGN